MSNIHRKRRELKEKMAKIPEQVENMKKMLKKTSVKVDKNRNKVDVSDLEVECEKAELLLSKDIEEESKDFAVQRFKSQKIIVDGSAKSDTNGIFATTVGKGVNGQVEKTSNREKSTLDSRINKLKKLNATILKNSDEVSIEFTKQERAKVQEISEKQKKLELILKVES